VRFGTAHTTGARYAPRMRIDPAGRRDRMILEFHRVQQRRLVRQGIGLWTQAEAAHRAAQELIPPRNAQEARDQPEES